MLFYYLFPVQMFIQNHLSTPRSSKPYYTKRPILSKSSSPQVNFKPVEAAPHTLSVRFNGQAVPGSPFTCAVSAPAAAADARASGPGLVSTPRAEPAEIQLTGFHSKFVIYDYVELD